MKYSAVVAIYKDGYLAEAFCAEMEKIFTPLVAGPLHKELEVIFVNDGSPDDSLAQLLALRQRYNFVKVVELSRNFGQHSALACGFHEASGDIVMRINVDQQDPLTELPKLIHVLTSEDADMVVGQYEERKSPLTSRITSGLYFILFRFLTGLSVPHNTSPMRVMGRRFINAYNGLTEKSRFPQGLDVWLGFKQRYVTIEHRERADKKSSYTFAKRMRLALDGILYFSDRPIKIVMGFGFVMACLGVLFGLGIVIVKLMGTALIPGYASLAVLALTTFGIQLASLGLVGLYIGRIFKEVQNRPLYLIREVYGQGH